MSQKEEKTEFNVNETPLQRTHEVCITDRKRAVKISVIFTLILAVGLFAIYRSVNFSGANFIKHPDFDENALEGAPEVGEEYGYSNIDVNGLYSVNICGLIANDGQNLDFYLTNPEKNNVWLRADISTPEGVKLGSTGVLKEGEYLKSITLDKPLEERETPVVVKIIAYEPHKWTSVGNVSLNLTIYKDYK